MINLVSIDDKTRWSVYVKNAFEYEFYHTWTYNSLDTSGDAFLVVFERDDLFIAIPLIRRRIKGTPYYDFSSVYGYCGPISSCAPRDLPVSFLADFQSSLLDFLKKQNYVSVFSRLNPFLDQNLFFEKLGGVFNNGRTVAIDLTISLEEQVSKYRRAFSSCIKKLRRLEYTVEVGQAASNLTTFISIYRENMSRVGACDYYYFDEPYFATLLNSKEYQCKFLFVCRGGEPVSAALVVFGKRIGQVHLLATRTDYLNQSPAKLLIHEATILARQYNLQYLNLGGGFGFKDDSLFHWKSGFSDLNIPYSTWRFVVNEQVYNQLIDGMEHPEGEEIDFFPLYRYEGRTEVSV